MRERASEWACSDRRTGIHTPPLLVPLAIFQGLLGVPPMEKGRPPQPRGRWQAPPGKVGHPAAGSDRRTGTQPPPSPQEPPACGSLQLLDSHPFILHRMMRCRSSPESPPSHCLDPAISVSPSAAGCGGQDMKDPYGINLRLAPQPLVWHPCCRPPVAVAPPPPPPTGIARGPDPSVTPKDSANGHRGHGGIGLWIDPKVDPLPGTIGRDRVPQRDHKVRVLRLQRGIWCVPCGK